MKYIIFASLILMAGCLKNSAPTPPPTPVKWIDVNTHNDTIITNAANTSNFIYYAIKNWQSFPDSNFAQGYRQLVATKADSVVVIVPNTTNKYYVYKIIANAMQDTLWSQNFLDTIHKTPVRAYTQIK